MIRLGYHPATFGATTLEQLAAALPVIRDEGWDGFEFGARTLESYWSDPQPIIDLLASTGIGVCGLYYTCSFLSDEDVAEWLDDGRRVIEFSRAIGCPLVMIDGGSKSEVGVTDEQTQRAATGADAMGGMCADADLLCSWHQHWGTIFEYAEPFERLLALTDPALVKFTPDTAQLSLGDFDLPETFARHVARMVYVHFKDLGEDRRFTELGAGVVDFPALWAIMREAGFAGWIVVDLDYTDLDPARSCHINKSYLDRVLNLPGS